MKARSQISCALAEAKSPYFFVVWGVINQRPFISPTTEAQICCKIPTKSPIPLPTGGEDDDKCITVLQRCQNVKRTCKSLSYQLQHIVQHCTRAGLAALFHALSKNRWLADRFATGNSIVSQSQAFFLSSRPLGWHGCHRHQFSKFPDFSLTKVKFLWPNKCKIWDMVAASILRLQESFAIIWPEIFQFRPLMALQREARYRFH